MDPRSQSKKKMSNLKITGDWRNKRMEVEDGKEERDLEGIRGGYDPVIPWILFRAGKTGGKDEDEEDPGDNSSDESECGEMSQEMTQT